MEKVLIGIDLGTTNSLAAFWENGQAHLIPNAEGELLTPSVVSYVNDEDGNGGFLVGKAAKGYVKGTGDTASSFKRYMGTNKKFFMGGKSCSALELSAMVLSKIKNDSEKYLGKEIEEAVITVPAYFNDKQRSDTKKAAQAAGLTVKRLINEPSAAALAYRSSYGEGDRSLLVFDFGGGTLDISLVECFEDVVEIIAVAGDNHLGGDDVDEAVCSYFCRQNKLERENMQECDKRLLLDKARQSKQALSSANSVDLTLDIDGKQCSISLTDDILFELCLPLFSRIKNLFLRILRDSHYRISDLDDIIMVGGSSQLSIVKRFLTELLGKAPVVLGDTDKVVAMGAGIYAGIRERRQDIRDLVLTDVCPFTLGVASYQRNGGEREFLLPMIERNSTLPTTYHTKLCTVDNYQDHILLKIYQGEEYFAEDNIMLGQLSIPVPPKPAGEAFIDVWFTYNLNGILCVEVCNEEGIKKNIQLANQELTEEEKRQCEAQLKQVVKDDNELQRTAVLQQRLKELYEQSTDTDRKRVEALMAWFLHGIKGNRKVVKRKVLQETERVLDSWKEIEDNLEDILFDGELKFEDTEME